MEFETGAAVSCALPCRHGCPTPWGMRMNEMTHILSAVEHGDAKAVEVLLPMGYDELRRLAAQRMANEKPGQTLNPTALVHEADLRLVEAGEPQHWHGRRHFFAAAAMVHWNGDGLIDLLVDTPTSTSFATCRIKRGALCLRTWVRLRRRFLQVPTLANDVRL